jgi:hypothetical protein
MKRNRLLDLAILEISAVDTPAQQPALARITKRKGTKTMENFDKLKDLTLEEFEFFKGLPSDKHQAYLDADSNGRESIAKADPIVYTSEDGVVFRKSDNPAFVALAQEKDALTSKLKETEKEGELLKLKQLVATDYAHLPGSDEDKMKLVAAALATGTESILKAKSIANKDAFVTKGTSQGNTEVESPQTLFNKGITALRESDPELDYVKAVEKFLETPEGRKLYGAMQAK